VVAVFSNFFQGGGDEHMYVRYRDGGTYGSKSDE